jgi:hypothetical protein
MGEIERVIVRLHGGHDDGVSYDTHGPHRRVEAHGVYLATGGAIGEVFFAPGDVAHLTQYIFGEVEYRLHRYKITERQETGGVLTLRADFDGVYEPKVG